MPGQLSLGLRLRDEAKFSNFYPKNNEQTLMTLEEMISGVGEATLFLWGPKSCGRTHLLHAVCARAQELGLSAHYIPLKDAHALSVDMLDGLAHTEIVCLDDIESIAGNKEWEIALFHFYNQARENQCRLVMTANVPPAQVPVTLPDLRSRLSWGLSLPVHALDDEEKLAALQLRAQCRGLKLNEAVGRFLLNRYARDMSILCEVLEELDSCALVAQRALTIPFVKQVLVL